MWLQVVRSAATSGKLYRLPVDKENTEYITATKVQDNGKFKISGARYSRDSAVTNKYHHTTDV